MAHRKILAVACALFASLNVSIATADDLGYCPGFEVLPETYSDEQIASLGDELTQSIVKAAEDEAPFRLLNIINWKEGDSSDFVLSSPSFGKLGKMHKFVAKDEGPTLWVTQDIDLSQQKEKIETQIRKSDGAVLQILRNGKPQEVPKDKPVVKEQEYVEIKVIAGKFKSMHITADTKDVKNLQIWANPKDTVMEGTLRQIVPTSTMTLHLELEKFKKAK